MAAPAPVGMVKWGMEAARRRRAQIVDAAYTRVAADATPATIEEIAADLGIARRTIYRYFPTRDHLILAVQARILEEFCEMILDHSARSEGSGLQRISELLRLFEERSGEFAAQIRFTRFFESTGIGDHTPDDDVGAQFHEVHERLVVHASELVDAGVSDGSVGGITDSRVVAATILNGYLALAQQVYIRFEMLDPDEQRFASATLAEQSRLYVRALATR